MNALCPRLKPPGVAVSARVPIGRIDVKFHLESLLGLKGPDRESS